MYSAISANGSWGGSTARFTVLGTVRAMTQALMLWDTEPLSDVPSAYLQRTEVPQLAELRHEALASRIDADLRLGLHGAVAAELRGLVARNPFRERFWEQLMLALYRVAHQVAEYFPDGQLFVALGGATSPASAADVLARLLRDLGVAESSIPAAAEERAARYRTAMADRKMLIVLDDAHGSAQVRPLLPGTGGSAVLVTSRSTLAGIAGSAFTGLSVLSPASSRTLFTSIVGSRRASDDPDATDEAVASCAGLPLAIRIAARPDWTIGQLSARLGSERQRLGELAADDMAGGPVSRSVTSRFPPAIPIRRVPSASSGWRECRRLPFQRSRRCAGHPRQTRPAPWRRCWTGTCLNHPSPTGSRPTTCCAFTRLNARMPTRPKIPGAARCTGFSSGISTPSTPVCTSSATSASQCRWNRSRPLYRNRPSPPWRRRSNGCGPSKRTSSGPWLSRPPTACVTCAGSSPGARDRP